MKPIETMEELIDMSRLDDDARAARAEGYHPATPIMMPGGVVVAAWSEGCPVALPEVDYVILTGEGKSPNEVVLYGAVCWNVLVRFVGDHGVFQHNRLCVPGGLFPKLEAMQEIAMPMRLLEEVALPSKSS